jgi:hypothetical protein
VEQLTQLIVSGQDVHYLASLEESLLALWEELAQNSQGESEQAVANFINQHSLSLLQIVTDYLRKQLKIPLYSAMYD